MGERTEADRETVLLCFLTTAFVKECTKGRELQSPRDDSEDGLLRGAETQRSGWKCDEATLYDSRIGIGWIDGRGVQSCRGQ